MVVRSLSLCVFLSCVMLTYAHVHEPPKHSQDGHHNEDYDHEAFLGKDMKEEFDHLSPEESKRRLGVIIAKIDLNSDNRITDEEMVEWMKKVMNKYVYDDVERSWKEYGLVNGHDLTLEDHLKKFKEEEADEDDSEHLQKLIEREKKRWQVADRNNDGQLDKKEFAAFLHPESHEHMKDIVTQEAMEDMDLNKDGKVDENEYMTDSGFTEVDSKDNEWITGEKEKFHNEMDANHDGFMDFEELKNWLHPSDGKRMDDEAKHLIKEADDDKNGVLSKEEILNHHDLFAGSEVTDYGEALRNFNHDEL